MAVGSPKAAAQPAGDVVFAAALPDLERAGRVDAAVARVEAQHDFAERDERPAAGIRRNGSGVRKAQVLLDGARCVSFPAGPRAV